MKLEKTIMTLFLKTYVHYLRHRFINQKQNDQHQQQMQLFKRKFMDQIQQH